MLSTSAQATDLAVLRDVLLADARAAETGRAVEVVIDQPGQKVVAMGFAAGGGLPEHDAPPAACLQVCLGEVTLVAGLDRWTVSAGQVISIPRRRHHVEAVQDSFALLTMTTLIATS